MCLLKGCGRWFVPERPQARYCGASCRRAAKRWRDWKAQRRYRETPGGREKRQGQSKRYRKANAERKRQSEGQAAPGPDARVSVQLKSYVLV